MSKRDIYRNISLILLLVVLLTGCGRQNAVTETEETSDITETIVIPMPKPAPEPHLVNYPALIDQYFDGKHHNLTLSNDKTNTVSFRFTLTDGDGTTLFIGEPIPAGEKCSWDVTERWSKSGDYPLTILSTPISEDGTEGNSVSQTIQIYLKFEK